MTVLEAYIAGALHGDGWCTASSIGLRCKDRDFAHAFCAALNEVCMLRTRVVTDERGYALVRTANTRNRFSNLPSFIPSNETEVAAWIKGLFDSEGNAQLTKMPTGVNCYHRRVAMYSTSLSTLQVAGKYLTILGISTRIRATKNSRGHKGSKTVFELALRCSKENFHTFANVVGSSIARKQCRLIAIVDSYVPDLSEACRANQKLGAIAKHRLAISRHGPVVLEGIRQLIKIGIKPTQRACRSIAGYNTLQRYYHQSNLVEMAKRGMHALH